jgi:hypothetical protein
MESFSTRLPNHGKKTPKGMHGEEATKSFDEFIMAIAKRQVSTTSQDQVRS